MNTFMFFCVIFSWSVPGGEVRLALAIVVAFMMLTKNKEPPSNFLYIPMDYSRPTRVDESDS